MENERKEEVVTVEIDTDTAEGMAILDGLSGGTGLDLSPAALLGVRPSEQTFSDWDELEAVEERENEGYWRSYPAVPDCAVLLAHPENALNVYSAIERELRAKEKIADDDPTPVHLVIRGTGLAAFGRSIKGWRGVTAKGEPLEFNAVNFMAKWRRRRFRDWVNSEWRKFSTDPQGLSEEAGKD